MYSNKFIQCHMSRFSVYKCVLLSITKYSRVFKVQLWIESASYNNTLTCKNYLLLSPQEAIKSRRKQRFFYFINRIPGQLLRMREPAR
jgi:hypothetical protein